jgi:hypothetical protein
MVMVFMERFSKTGEYCGSERMDPSANFAEMHDRGSLKYLP